ncbi:MAG TPA: CARDB domain-containing protein, partial [Verrucomicrobiae bacterium]|nr:CARDB domain-containing protein [Verrucomicrobiae bacterium]
VNLGGNFTTADLGNFIRTGGTVNLVGTLNNSNATLTLNGPDQSWVMGNGGDIESGTVITTNGAALIGNSSGTLDGVTIDGTLDVGNTINGGWVNVINGLTLNGTMLVGNPTNGWYGYVNFANNESLLGNATVIFGNSGPCNALRIPNGGVGLTLGPNVLVEGYSGQIGSTYQYCFGGPQNVIVTNQGTISASLSGGTIYVTGSPVINQGQVNIASGANVIFNYLTNVVGINATGGAVTFNGNYNVNTPLNFSSTTIVLNGNYTINSPITMTNGTLTLNGNWTNGSAINVSNTTVNLGGSFNLANLGNFTRSGGTVNLTGAFNNTNTTLTLNGPDQSWVLASGANIEGGTVITTNGAALIAYSGDILNGVTLNGNLDVGNTFNTASVTVTNGLVLNGTAWVGNPTNGWYGGMAFAGTQTLSGNGTVIFGNASLHDNALYLSFAATTLNIGSGIALQGGNGTVGSPGPTPWPGSYQNVIVTDAGPISVSTNGGTIDFVAQPFNSTGTISIPAGAVDVSSTSSINGTVNFGINAVNNYGQLVFASAAPLAGITANISLNNGFVPALSNSFPLITYTSETGPLAAVNFPTPSDGISWQFNYGTTAGSAVAANVSLPSISITSPASNSTFAVGATIPIDASVTDTNAAISMVEFFENGQKIGEVDNPPYNFNWNSVPFGIYNLTAKATDAVGATAVSSPVNVTVYPGGSGTNFIWTGAVSSDWYTPGNWNPVGVPGPLDTITLTNNKTTTLSSSAVIASANIGSATLNGAGVLTVTNALLWSGGTIACPLVLPTGVTAAVTGNSDKYLLNALTNSGVVTWSGTGNFHVYYYTPSSYFGQVQNFAGGVWNIQNDQSFENDYNSPAAVFANAGSLTKVGGVNTTYFNVPLLNSGTVTVQEGTLDLQGGGVIESNFVIQSNATLYLASGAFVNTLPALTSGTGKLQMTGGTLTLTSATIPGLLMTGGTLNLGMNFQGGTISNLTISGVTLAGTNTVTGTLAWNAGTVQGPLNISPSGIVNMGTGSDKYFENIVTNQGTINWNGGNLHIYNYAPYSYFGQIQNLAGANWNIQCDQNLGNDYSASSVLFNNAGSFTKLANGNSTYISVPFANSGTVTAQQGNIYFESGGPIEGAYVADAGASIYFNGGNFTQQTGATYTGPGNIQFNNGTLTLENDVIPGLALTGGNVVLGPAFQGGTITNLTLSGGTLTGTNTVTGTLNWNAGVINGPLGIASGAFLNLNTSADKYLENVLTNSGTVTWNGGNFHIYNYAPYSYFGQAQNLSGGIWNIACDQTIGNDYGSSAILFSNGGSFTKIANANNNTSVNVPFSNSGLVTAQQGNIYFQGGGPIQGAYVANSGSAIYFNGGTFTDGAAATFTGNVLFNNGTLDLINNNIPGLAFNGGTIFIAPTFEGGTITNFTFNGGTLTGTNVVTGTFTWNGGTVAGPLTISNGATLNISGSAEKYLESPLTNGGSVIWTGTGNFHIYNYSGGFTGQVQNLQGGVWSAQNDQNIYNDYGQGSVLFNNAGTFIKQNSVNTTSVNGVFNNSGVLRAVTGTINFANNNDYVQTGATDAININGVNSVGHLTFAGKVNIDGTLEVDLANGYVPFTGEFFPLLNFGSYAGGFQNFNLPALGPGQAWLLAYTPTTLSMTVVGAGSGLQQITGSVQDNVGPVTNLDVYAYATNGSNISYVSSFTDINGNYVLNVPNGTWTVGIQGLAARGYNPVATQQAVISGSGAVVNFVLQPFTGALYTILASVNPPGVGTVAGSGNYLPGSQVTLTAALNSSNALPYSFLDWTENGSVQTTNTVYSFPASRNRQLVANFGLPQFTITAFNNPAADGSVTGAGTYSYGTTNSLTAFPNAGYDFSYWGSYAFYQFSQGGVNGTQYPFNISCTLTQGETMDFIVSCHNGDYSYLGTGLKATVTYTNGGTATVYDAVNDFSTNVNPGAVWSYGWSTNIGGPFQLMNNNFTAGPTDSGWGNGMSLPYSAVVDKDFGSSFQSGTVIYDPDTLHMDPQLYASIVRFTAPSNGSYQVSGLFRMQDTGSHAHDLAVVLGSNFISSSPTISVVLYSNVALVANYVDAVPTHVVTTATSPGGLASISGAGTYSNGMTANIVAPALVTNAPYLYTFQDFTLNGSYLSGSTTVNKTFTTFDPANLNYVAVYTAKSVLPLVTHFAANLPNIVPATANYQMRFQFDRTMNTNIVPTILLTNVASALQPVAPTNGVWGTTSVANDTFMAASMAFVEGMDGTNQVFISGAQDTLGNVLAPTNVFNVVVDATPPNISNLTNTPSITTANITWNTDEPATSQVEYGLDTSYGQQTAFSPSLVNNHLQQIQGLNPSTLYHYRVHSKDAVGNEAISADATLTTLADTVPPHTFLTSGPSQNGTACSLPVIFIWSATDNVTPATNMLYAYRLDGGSYSVFSNWTSVSYTSLADGNHSFQVAAQDQAGNIDPTPVTILFTVSTQPPQISGVAGSGTNAQITITWLTDQLSTSDVEYGPTSSYGTLAPINTALVNAHNFTVTGLVPGQTYHYRVHSQTFCGHDGVSGDFTVTIPADTVPPQTIMTGGPGNGGFTCSLPVVFDWLGSDNVSATANLVYAYSVDGGALSPFSSATTVSLNGLSDGAHTFKVVARDQAGNIDPIGATVNFTLNTATAPVISNITTSSTPGTETISWNTDQPSTSKVNYGLTTGYGNVFNGGGSDTNHSVTLTELIPGTNYHFQIVSANQCGRQGVSGDNVFVSAPAPDLQVSAISGPAAASTGNPFDVTWTITNASSVPITNTWYDAVYLCSSNSPCTSYLLGQFVFTNGLGANGSVTLIHSVTVDRNFVTNGNYYLTVEVNYGQLVYEGQPGSPAVTNDFGVSAQPVAITLTPLPDLVISQVSVPTNQVFSGQSISVDWIECNVGQAATGAPSWNDHVYLYGNTNLTQLIADYGGFPNISFLGPGECYEQNVDLALPAGLQGPYYVVVKADDLGNVQELTKTNNIGVSGPLSVQYVPPGFFHVVSTTVAPAPPTAAYLGDLINISYTIENTGGVPISGHWDNALAITPVPVWNGAVNQIAQFHINAENMTLLPGQSYSAQATVRVPLNVSPGTNYVIVLADPHPYQPTVGKDQLPVPIIIAQPPPADLQIGSVTAPTNGAAGQPVTVSWAVTNNGLAATSFASWVDGVYLTTNSTLDITNDTQIFSVTHQGVLQVGDSYTNTSILPLPSNLTGAFTLYVYTDVGKNVYEGPYRNNNYAAAPQSITITNLPPGISPDLQVANVTCSSPAVAGLPRAVSWQVMNNGGISTPIGTNWYDSVYLSLDGSLDPAKSVFLASYKHVGLLAAGASYAQTQQVPIPPCDAGTYYVVVVADSSNAVPEALHTDNSSATVTPVTIAPSQL